MEYQADNKPALQWHPAFYADIQIEFADEADKMWMENEHQLGTRPKEIDVLIIKKNSDEPIEKNIGQIFRKHNIVEYKSPVDYLSIDDFCKVYAYAWFYKADTSTEDSIKTDDITISFVVKRYPGKLIKYLREIRGYEVVKHEKGIYYVIGDIFPMQIIVTSRLTKEKNFWLKNLTDDIKDSETVKEISEEYRKNQKSELHRSVMNVIVRANKESFKEGNDMCEAIVELFQDEYDAGVKAAREAGLQQGIERGIELGIKSLVESLQKLEMSRNTTKEEICEKFNLTEEKAISYMEKYWK